VKFKKSVTTPTHGWQGANIHSVGFVQSVPDKDNLIVSFCSGEVRLLANEVIKVIPLDRGQHVQLKEDVKEPRYITATLSFPPFLYARASLYLCLLDPFGIWVWAHSYVMVYMYIWSSAVLIGNTRGLYHINGYYFSLHVSRA